jgi:phospholipid/cholesterol/gamma-HCH transport system substrate-binding protein
VAPKTNHWKLGLFVVTGLAIGLATVFWLGLRRLNREYVPAVTYFDESVQGLDVGSPVKFRGVTLGTVATITVAPDRRLVEVWMHIYTDALRRMGFAVEERPTDPTLRPQLASAGITGVKFVQFDTFSPERYPIPELSFTPPERFYIPAVPSTLKSLEEVANEFASKLPKLTDQLNDTLLEAKKSLRMLSDVASWVRGDSGLKRTVASFDEAARTLKQAIHDAELAQTTGSLRTAAGSVNSAAGKLGGQSGQLEETLRALRETLEAVRALAVRLERDPSAVLRGRTVEEGK